ncbi:MAG: hypothetical protein HN348_19180 [Proteobacteria bacterium]|jgi:hypothetical protein|nr:hypothetical protein [Pseudomonadota bacterium]
MQALPELRCMRDMDILVTPEAADEAQQRLIEGRWEPGVLQGPEHHHLDGLERTIDGLRLGLEVHRRVTLSLPLDFDDWRQSAVPCRGALAPSRLNRVWHAYTHGCCLDLLCSENFHLAWLADIVTLVEASTDDELAALRRWDHFWNALAWLGQLVSFEPRIQALMNHGNH